MSRLAVVRSPRYRSPPGQLAVKIFAARQVSSASFHFGICLMRRVHSLLPMLLVGVLLCCTTGCLGTVANLIHAGWGNLVPAGFDQLAGRSVAVVCLSGSTSFGNSSAATEIAERIERKLRQRVPELTLIPQQDIEDWMDRNDWNEIDYRELSDGVDCDFLIAVDFDNFSLYEGQTLYKGRADVGLSVYESEKGETVYGLEPLLVEYPLNGGQHTADTREADFRDRYLDVISSYIARQFYSYDVKEDYARDPTFVGM